MRLAAMKRRWPIMLVLVLVAALLGTAGCTAPPPSSVPPPSSSNFNLTFKYGIGAWNELNTSQGTYTKDMIMDPPITVNLSLSKEELDRIYQKMVEINFFGYPDKFSVSVSPGESVGMVTPYCSYYFKVEYDAKVKELSWKDNIINEDKKAEKLRELINLIRDIIESKEEYKQLPPPKGGYQ
jgi:hypothetical protein